jgi:hypothetical protein
MLKAPVRIFLLRRSHIAIITALLLSAALFYAVTYPSSVSVSASGRQLPIYSVERAQKLCSKPFLRAADLDQPVVAQCAHSLLAGVGLGYAGYLAAF